MRNYIEIVLVVAILGAFGYAVWDYQATKAENKRLSSELTTANYTITALDTLVKKNREIEAERDGRIEEIDKEPETNDAPTAPTLLNAINRLR